MAEKEQEAPAPQADAQAAEKPWYDGWTTDAEELKTISRYKSPQTFKDAFFEQRKTISESIHAPDPKAKPDEQAMQLRLARQRLGAFETPEKYTVIIPDDLKEFVDGNLPNFIPEMQRDAATYGLTQKEVETLAAAKFDKIRAHIAERKKAEEEQQRTKDELLRRNDEFLTKFWGNDKELQLNNARLMAAHFDDTLFFQDNQGLSDEERAERGGILTQMLRSINHPVLWRAFAHLHNRLLAGPNPPGGKDGGRPNAASERMARIKAAWPKRPEMWDVLARDPSVVI